MSVQTALSTARNPRVRTVSVTCTAKSNAIAACLVQTVRTRCVLAFDCAALGICLRAYYAIPRTDLAPRTTTTACYLPTTRYPVLTCFATCYAKSSTECGYDATRPTAGMTELELESATGHAPLWRSRYKFACAPTGKVVRVLRVLLYYAPTASLDTALWYQTH
eukprot:1927455-Rhodomonas_salina.2